MSVFESDTDDFSDESATWEDNRERNPDTFVLSNGIVSKYYRKDANVFIPSCIFGALVKGIGNKAFYKSGLKSICFPATLEIIADECFCYCKSLISVDFSSESHLKSIGNGAFSHSGLKSICLPSTLESIGDECFSECRSLTNIQIPSDFKLREKLEESSIFVSGRSIRVLT